MSRRLAKRRARARPSSVTAVVDGATFGLTVQLHKSGVRKLAILVVSKDTFQRLAPPTLPLLGPLPLPLFPLRKTLREVLLQYRAPTANEPTSKSSPMLASVLAHADIDASVTFPPSMTQDCRAPEGGRAPRKRKPRVQKCHTCREAGHIAKDCPNQPTMAEAPGTNADAALTA